MNNIDSIIENIHEYCDRQGIPFPEITTNDTSDKIIVTMTFEVIE